jgi:hypothetical protein
MVASDTTKKLCLALGLFAVLFSSPLMNAQAVSPSTGIEGTISIGPSHGGPIKLDESASAPLANTAFDVVNDSGVVTSFQTDASGQFRVLLAPGRYSIKAHDVKARYPRCGPFEVEVITEGFKKMQWVCDSGMR